LACHRNKLLYYTEYYNLVAIFGCIRPGAWQQAPREETFFADCRVQERSFIMPWRNNGDYYSFKPDSIIQHAPTVSGRLRAI